MHYKVAFYVESNPYTEIIGSNKYPMIRFYSGYIKMITDIIGIKDICFIPMLENMRIPSNKDVLVDSDIYYLEKLGYNIHLSDKRSNDTYDIILSTNLQSRPTQFIDNLNDLLMDRCDKFIYFDTDTEPTSASKVNLYKMIDGYGKIKSKLKAVIISEGTIQCEVWNKYAKTYFIPYIPHPYYDMIGPVFLNKEYDLAMARSTSSERLLEVIRRYKYYDVTGKGTGIRTTGLEEMDKILSKCSMTLGTITGYVSPLEYRSTSKVIETLHAGSLLTTYDTDLSLIIDNRYPYLKDIPKELRCLNNTKYVTEESLIKAIEFGKNNCSIELVEHLYNEIKSYHDATNWKSVMKEVLNA